VSLSKEELDVLRKKWNSFIQSSQNYIQRTKYEIPLTEDETGIIAEVLEDIIKIPEPEIVANRKIILPVVAATASTVLCKVRKLYDERLEKET
jgi:hypothetical protein